MGNKLCADESIPKKQSVLQQNSAAAAPTPQTNLKNERLNSIIDLNEYKLPQDPKEETLFKPVNKGQETNE